MNLCWYESITCLERWEVSEVNTTPPFSLSNASVPLWLERRAAALGGRGTGLSTIKDR